MIATLKGAELTVLRWCDAIMENTVAPRGGHWPLELDHALPMAMCHDAMQHQWRKKHVALVRHGYESYHSC